MKTRIRINPTFDIETGKLISHDGEYWIDEEDIPVKFDRAAQQAAKTAVAGATGTAAGFGGTATGIGSTLIPTLTQEATHPQGFAPQDVNAMLVAGEQGAGGANAGVTGEANLRQMRSRNAGGFSGALDQAARIKGQQLSQNALGVQGENAQLKEKQRQAGISGLQNMYGTDVSAQMKAMGLIPEDINAQVNAGKSGWLQNTTDLMKAAGSDISAIKA